MKIIGKTMLVAMLLMLNCNLMAQNSQSRALWGSICNNKNISNKADYQQHSKKVLPSWRMLPSDDATTAFDLYRKAGADGTEEKIASGITGSTCYQDLTIDKTKDNTYRLTFADSNETLDTYTMTAEFAAAGQPYVTIPLKSTEDITTDPQYRYRANDCSVGDLDGDGQMEIVVKRLLSVWDVAQDTLYVYCDDK